MGIQRATVTSNDDPLAQGRVQVTVVENRPAAWAERVVAASAQTTPEQIAVGSAVWVAYEDDDAERPVVIGLVDSSVRPSPRTADVEALGDAWDQGHAAGRADATGTTTPNPYR